MRTDITERGLETMIYEGLLANGWLSGSPDAYDRAYAIDVAQLRQFLADTQPELIVALDLDGDSNLRHQALSRIQGEIAKRGIVDVLRKGVKFGPHTITFYYPTPTPGNRDAEIRFAANRFSVTRQLRYSADQTRLALDLALFINGLPIATFELKNNLTKQNVQDAIEQYRRDRDPKELLFQFKRCLVHFAVDDAQVYYCTRLDGAKSWFLPFNKGHRHGAGNPPNSNGLKTAYLWEEILTPAGLADILENYAQVVEEENLRTSKKTVKQIFPRFHQLDVVRQILAHIKENGAGHKYLIEHSAGSGKSNSIAWLVLQLAGLQQDEKPLFGTVIVVTDRRVLDRQLSQTVAQFAQVKATVGHAKSGSDQLRRFIEEGKKIIISTVQKFPHILDEIGDQHRDRTFAIVIDEAHSSQGGKATTAMNRALGAKAEGVDEDEELTVEDVINREMESRKLLANASYFAFTATPKNKTLELFGTSTPEGGARPFHLYSMKQAIEEGFIMDVLESYTPIKSYYHLVKTVEHDPQFDEKKAHARLRRFVESDERAIRAKAEIMVDHFLERVIGERKVGGKARAMVVTSSIERAFEYWRAITAYLKELNSPYKTIVAFSGEHDFGSGPVTEATLNGFPSNEIEDRIREDPYRILVCADKFQTGYDEPLLHTMYIDKPLSDVKAVQTLSRLNRVLPEKQDTFVLDFYNDVDIIQSAFERYYTTTILSGQTDPNKLHDLVTEMEKHQVFTAEQIDTVCTVFLTGGSRTELDPVLDVCVGYYNDLDEEDQVAFKSAAKTFLRTYNFLASILPYNNPEWEKLSIFLNLLVPKLPAPKDQDFAEGITAFVDLDSYRAEKQQTRKIKLGDEGAEIDPIPVSSGAGGPTQLELDFLSNILREFNDIFGNIEWTDEDRVRRLITEEIPNRVAADEAFQNALQHSGEQNARIEGNAALGRVMGSMVQDDVQLYRQFTDNPDFARWLSEIVFVLASRLGSDTPADEH